jgi:GMP synthase (glutamine-hydrolysing)
VHVLAVIHGSNCRAGTFGEVVDERGHELEEWSLAWGTPIPRPLDAYGAVLVFGGAMHADQDEHHPWLREENLFLQRAVDLGLPVMGVCLGAQLLAKAAHSPVYRLAQPEIGWHPIGLTEAAADDPVFSGLPDSFEAFQWHHYSYDVPAGAVELARNAACTQAFRLGDRAWGIQFHAEVTQRVIESWLEEEPEGSMDSAGLVAATEARIDGWNGIGRELCAAFVEVAERVATPA